MTRRAAIVLAFAGALALPAAADARTGSCAGRRPTLVAFAPGATRATGVVSWRRPLRPRAVRLRYRLVRNGAVVGQTARRRMSVRVSAGRRYRFRVYVVLLTGRVAPCPARLTTALRRALPTPPRDLAASAVTDTSATLSWTPGRARGAKAGGTRIFRDGEPLRQVAGGSTTVALAPRRSYVFTARTVDSAGTLSAESNRVTIRTGHRPPAAPQALAVTGIGDSRAELGWQASAPGSGRIGGYRVYRDGTPLFQVPGTTAAVTGLAAAHSYAVTVAAVDSFGYLSEPSAPVTVTTALPSPAHGRTHAFLLASTGQSFADLRDHYERIGTLYPTYYECAADGTIGGGDQPNVTRWAQLRGIRVLPRVDCQSTTRLHLILTDPPTRAAVLARLGELAATNGFDGLNVDFEAGAASDRDALTSFVTELAAILHGQGKRISVAVSATTRTVTSGRAAFYDYPALGAVADTVFVMNWGKHWSTSTPGALADLPWATEVADFVATMPNKSRYVLGAGLYGMDWASGGGPSHPAAALEYGDVQSLIAATAAAPVVDPVAGAPHFSYVDAGGVAHDVWYTDAASVDARVRLARDRGLGFGVWRLGREDPAIWEHPLLADPLAWPG
ncbi:MAG TPA: glycosyl hydrolase family 18 protein [Solirubrobacteraceae bacterium]|nr:glycosyl hydrolase family 18 protein [Solirubrobacteraceae bacterium]